MNLTSAARGFWTSFSSSALDFVYPSKCPLCGLLAPISPCEACRTSMALAHPNTVVESQGPLEFRACVFAYEGRAAQAVRRLKYSRSTSLAAFMAESVAGLIRRMGQEEDLVVPIPLYWARRMERGFNQSEFIAAGDHGLEVCRGTLRRTRNTRPQAGLTLRERQENLRGAFTAGEVVKGRPILLVDDVVTSGQTGQACAEALLAVGADSVGIVAFAGNLE